MLRAVAASLLLVLPAFAEDKPKEYKPGEWVPIFNGKNLDGWKPKIKGYDYGENFGDTFQVKDGILKVDYSKYDNAWKDRYGHLFYQDKFSHSKSASSTASSASNSKAARVGLSATAAS